MSRIGRAPIKLASGVDVSVNNSIVKVKGPKGQLEFPISSRLSVKIDDGVLTVERPSDHRDDRAQHGLARSLINNAVIGVSQGYTRNLEIRGVGYRANAKNNVVDLSLGFSHPVSVAAPEGVTIETPEPTKIVITGIDKQVVGQVAANIRAKRPPDSYHGKGVRYEGEHIRLKPGKAAAAAG
ncbi:MAG TPA: 50S ribosomal protein L6 [Trueperaceae bacterium]|nr:50S ribosomal protein L6 [Trueperaceae bacterium]